MDLDNYSPEESHRQSSLQVSELNIPSGGLIVHLKDYGKIKVFKVVHKKEDVDYYATNNLEATLSDIREAAARRWKVEEYHRGLKQTCGLEKCQARSERSQRTHIFCAILSFIFLEIQRLNEGISWYQTKRILENYAVKSYLKQPLIAFDFAGGG
jgi:putative transposase